MEVWNLRSHRCFRALRRAFARGCERFGFRLVHFSVQGNHAHFIVEAPDEVALGRAMKGLAVRMARALNKVMRRSGPVFADRYHALPLRSPRQVRHAIHYVLQNRAVHALRDGMPPPAGVDP
jgi:REP element-mobilizing transposase RayT